MKLQDSYNEIIAEQLAQVYLSRTGLVVVQKSLDISADLIALRKDKPEEHLLVEAKATNIGEAEIPVKFKDIIQRNTTGTSQNPSIIFFINTERQTGYFQIFSPKNERKLHPLRMDLLSTELSKYFSSIGGMEFPPYSFYQRDDDAKYSTRDIPLDSNFAAMRLYNFTLSPIELAKNIKITITVQQGRESKSRSFSYPQLFYNPRLVDFLFFVDKETGAEYTDILLPPERKYVKIQVESPENKNFEMKLACEYLVRRQR